MTFDSATVTLAIFVATAIFAAGGLWWQVWSVSRKVDAIIDNHLPHINRSLDSIRERLARVEAR